jgi:hypothetical protein
MTGAANQWLKHEAKGITGEPMATEWIIKAARKYDEDQTEKRSAAFLESQRQNAERARQERIAKEGPTAGAALWAGLQSIIKNDVAEFNKEFGDTILRTKALGDGTFEIRLSEPDGKEKIAALNYAPDKMTLSWQIFGGVKGTPMTVGIQPNPTPYQLSITGLQFTMGSSYPSLDEISRNILENLIP